MTERPTRAIQDLRPHRGPVQSTRLVTTLARRLRCAPIRIRRARSNLDAGRRSAVNHIRALVRARSGPHRLLLTFTTALLLIAGLLAMHTLTGTLLGEHADTTARWGA